MLSWGRTVDHGQEDHDDLFGGSDMNVFCIVVCCCASMESCFSLPSDLTYTPASYRCSDDNNGVVGHVVAVDGC